MPVNEELISRIILSGESEFVDFKRDVHTNKADLIHDIICLSNSEYSGERYLVFGVDDCHKVVGLQGIRRTQAQIIDLMRNAKFNHLPTVRLHTLNINGVEVDVLEIKNRPEKPYFLLKDYREGQKTIRAGVVYTRNADTNTPVDQCADDIKMERMFRERFSLDRSPLERVKVYLRDVENWKYGNDHNRRLYFYYIPFPEFTISEKSDSAQDFDEPWVHEFPHNKGSQEEFYLMYHSTILEPVYLVWCDGARFLTVMPEQKFIEWNGVGYTAYYFIENSTDDLINKMIQTVYPVRNRLAATIFFSFESEDEADFELMSDVNNNSKKYVFYCFDNMEDDYFRLQQGQLKKLFQRRGMA
ncbi:MAG: AlbA family DNA-binding domain-containing protein [Pseudobdellovibrionaceae bacterium]